MLLNVYSGAQGIIASHHHFSSLHYISMLISGTGCTVGAPQGPIMAIDTYCTLTVPQWVSSSGCSTFESSLELLDLKGNLLGELMLYGGIGQQFFMTVSNSTLPPMAIYSTFPTSENFTIILQYSYGMLQLSSVTQNLPIITTTFAYTLPPWGLEVYGLRTGSSPAFTSSTWILNGCASSTTLDIEPYVPSADSKQLPCLGRFYPQPPLSTPFANGGVAYATVYPSMSGICYLDLSFDIIIPSNSVHIMSIGDGDNGNQTIYWDKQPVYTGPAFIAKYQPTILWFTVNIAGYSFVGVGNPNSVIPEAITTLPGSLMLDSNSMLYARTGTSDWTVTALNWMPAIESCEWTPNTDLNVGQHHLQLY